MVQTKAGVLAAIQSHAARLRDFGVRRCGLFGSFVREHGAPGSDIDVLVEFEADKKTIDNFMHLAFFLKDLLERPVDLVTPDSLSPHIGPHILREVEYVPVST